MYKQHTKESEFVNRQKKRVEIYYKGNYKEIKKITFTKTKKIPTGTILLSAYVNDDTSLSFNAYLTPYEDYEIGSTESPEFSDTFNSINDDKTVSELLKEQKEKQSH